MTYSRRFATWKYKGAAQEVVYFQEALLRTVLMIRILKRSLEGGSLDLILYLTRSSDRYVA